MEKSTKLYARFLEKSNAKLVEIIESKEDYTTMAYNLAQEIIEERKIQQEELQFHSTEFWKKKFNASIKDYLKSQKIPESNFIQESELKKIMKEAYEEYLRKRESMEVDSTKYWFV